MTSDKTELKPCPACKYPVEIQHIPMNKSFILCRCGIKMEDQYSDRLTERWNTRPAPPSQTDLTSDNSVLIEKLEKLIPNSKSNKDRFSQQEFTVEAGSGVTYKDIYDVISALKAAPMVLGNGGKD